MRLPACGLLVLALGARAAAIAQPPPEEPAPPAVPAVFREPIERD